MSRMERSTCSGVGCTAAKVNVFIIAALAALAVAGQLQAGDLVPPPGVEGYFADEENSAKFENLALDYLNELSARRRLTTVFPNEQSPFYGVQLNYVNVREGNLTFLMRDLVRGGRLPIMFGRIYDSRIREGSGFGQGWKLSVSESIQLRRDELKYTDASNSTYVLRTDGSSIWSEYPHLTGIDSGTLGPATAVIQSGRLTKTFRRRGNSFRLVEVEDQSGNWLRLDYLGNSISRISSSTGRFVAFERNQSTMRVVAAQDDTGRRTRYRYDAGGALTESVGVDGEVTQYVYDGNGYLSRVVDSRGFESISAEFRDDGRVARIHSQHEKTVFEFDANRTTVRNAQQQTSVVGFHTSGLVESVTDFAGSVTNLRFDEDLRVRQLILDGATLVSAEYQDGQLATLSHLDSGATRHQYYRYDSRDRLVRVVEGGEEVAAYRYDDADRAIYAMDSSQSYFSRDAGASDGTGGAESSLVGGVVRRYRFNAVGDLTGLSIDNMRLGFDVNRLGMVERVVWAENNEIGITYSDADRVQELSFRLGEDSFGSEFQYDDAGYRVAGRYDILEALGDTEIALDYDASGNLVRVDIPWVEGTRRTVQHTIGTENELLKVTPLGAEGFEQAIEYDESGRAIRSVQGDGREASFEYDELGRLTDVYLDREHVLTSDHGPMDLDPVHETDARTAFTVVSNPVASAVFGSLDEIVYTRPIGTPYGIARFVPEMARFVVTEHPVVPPDALTLASLRRRNLATDGTLNASPMQGFDKPSSSLFLPPEFFSTNCVFCFGGVSGFDVDRVGSGPVGTGETITFVADGSSDYCYFYDYQQGPILIPRNFVHDVDFIGGSGDATYTSSSAYKQFSGSFSSTGTKTVRDTLTCSCGGLFSDEATETVEVCAPADVAGFNVHNAAGNFTTRTSFYQSRYIFSNPASNTFRFSILPLQNIVPSEHVPEIETSAERWNAQRGMCGITYNSQINFDWRSSSTANIRFEYVDTLSPCGEATIYTSGTTIEVIKIRCLDAQTTAHEVGHILGFKHGSSTSDLMYPSVVAGAAIHGYHIRKLLETYF